MAEAEEKLQSDDHFRDFPERPMHFEPRPSQPFMMRSGAPGFRGPRYPRDLPRDSDHPSDSNRGFPPGPGYNRGPPNRPLSNDSQSMSNNPNSSNPGPGSFNSSMRGPPPRGMDQIPGSMQRPPFSGPRGPPPTIPPPSRPPFMSTSDSHGGPPFPQDQPHGSNIDQQSNRMPGQVRPFSRGPPPGGPRGPPPPMNFSRGGPDSGPIRNINLPPPVGPQFRGNGPPGMRMPPPNFPPRFPPNFSPRAGNGESSNMRSPDDDFNAPDSTVETRSDSPRHRRSPDGSGGPPSPISHSIQGPPMRWGSHDGPPGYRPRMLPPNYGRPMVPQDQNEDDDDKMVCDFGNRPPPSYPEGPRPRGFPPGLQRPPDFPPMAQRPPGFPPENHRSNFLNDGPPVGQRPPNFPPNNQRTDFHQRPGFPSDGVRPDFQMGPRRPGFPPDGPPMGQKPLGYPDAQRQRFCTDNQRPQEFPPNGQRSSFPPDGPGSDFAPNAQRPPFPSESQQAGFSHDGQRQSDFPSIDQRPPGFLPQNGPRHDFGHMGQRPSFPSDGHRPPFFSADGQRPPFFPEGQRPGYPHDSSASNCHSVGADFPRRMGPPGARPGGMPPRGHPFGPPPMRGPHMRGPMRPPMGPPGAPPYGPPPGYPPMTGPPNAVLPQQSEGSAEPSSSEEPPVSANEISQMDVPESTIESAAPVDSDPSVVSMSSHFPPDPRPPPMFMNAGPPGPPMMMGGIPPRHFIPYGPPGFRMGPRPPMPFPPGPPHLGFGVNVPPGPPFGFPPQWFPAPDPTVLAAPQSFPLPAVSTSASPNVIAQPSQSNLMGALESAAAGGEVWVENPTADGKIYYYNLQTRLSRWDRPEGVKIIRQNEMEQMVGAGRGAAVGSNQTQTQGPTSASAPNIVTSQKPPEVLEWTEYRSQDNRLYYHNARTGETVWDRPQVLLDYEKKVAALATPVATTQSNTLQVTPSIPTTLPVATTSNLSDAPPGVESNTDKKATTPSDNSSSDEEEESEHDEEEDQSSDDEKSDAQENKSRPISSTPISGTPWCVVWTADSKVFFYNPSKRISVWEKPDELKGRAEVDSLLEKPPKEAVSNSDVLSKPTRKADSTSSDAPPNKKIKTNSLSTNDVDMESDEGSRQRQASTSDEDSDQVPVNISNQAKPKANQSMDAAKEAEQKAAQMRALLPREVRISQFRELLMEKQVSAYSTWKQELHKIVFDSRYLLLTSKERKEVFDQYIQERAEEERQEKKNKIRLIKDQFKELLKDANVTTKTSFSDFSARYAKDERLKAIDKSREREQLFLDYVDELKKKEKEKKSKSKDEVKSDFFELLSEQKGISKKTHWSDCKKKIDQDARYKAVDSSTRREEWFKEYLRKLEEESDEEESSSRRERERKEREEASLRKREEEVKEALSSSLRDRDKEREAQQREEASTIFQALLVDLVKDPSATWKDMKRVLEKDSRWDASAEVLSRAEREQRFKEHTSQLSKKNKEMFHKLFSENSAINLKTTWKQARKLVKDDPRFEKYSSSDRKREHEFTRWQEAQLEFAKNAFRELLMETKAITYKSRKSIAENDSHMREIISLLEKDKRYLFLEDFDENRKQILDEYIDELDKKGPPPPPTASEPSRRK
jgi:transcription elongation regulator 1